MQAQRVGPSDRGGADSRVELRIVIGQQRSERGTMSDRIALEIGPIAEFRELAVRRAYFRTFEVIYVEISQQMQPGLSATTSITAPRL